MTNFTKITPTSQRGKAIIRSYEHSHISTLREAYAYHYSQAKEKAYDDCVAMMEELNGYGLRITGACGTNFSVGFVFRDDNGKKCLAYITYRNDYVIPDYDDGEMDIDEFEKRWDENVSDDIKARTARALDGNTVTSMKEATSILKMAEAFSLLQKICKK